VTVNWLGSDGHGNSNGPGATYLVQASSYTDYSQIAGSSLTANTFAMVGGLTTADTQYYFRVWAINSLGTTNYAYTAMGSLIPAGIESPTNVVFDDISSMSITASAYAPTPAFTGLGVGSAGTDVAMNGVYAAWHTGGDSWTTLAALPTPRGYFGAAAVGGKVYVVGGSYNGVGGEAQNEAYDPVANSWTTQAVMPTARYGLSAVAVGGKVYAVGGYGNTQQENEAYDPVANSWTTQAAMPTARYGLAAAMVSGKVYVVGGYNMNQN
jgi:hypothetical protein